MSERDLYIQSIPRIVEMIVICQGMAPEQYRDFKKEWLAEVERDQPKALPFIRKVFIVIDTCLEVRKNAVHSRPERSSTYAR